MKKYDWTVMITYFTVAVCTAAFWYGVYKLVKAII